MITSIYQVGVMHQSQWYFLLNAESNLAFTTTLYGGCYFSAYPT